MKQTLDLELDLYFKILLIDEIKLLKSRENLSEEQIEEAKMKPKQPPIQPYILTRDALQAQVFGAGYPSLPVYSVEQFFDQLVDKGCMPLEGGNNCTYGRELCKVLF